MLLEPLQCYGGLGSDSVPEGQAKIIVDRDPATYEQLLLTVHPTHRSAEVPVSAYAPLMQLARRAGPNTTERAALRAIRP